MLNRCDLTTLRKIKIDYFNSFMQKLDSINRLWFIGTFSQLQYHNELDFVVFSQAIKWIS